MLAERIDHAETFVPNDLIYGHSCKSGEKEEEDENETKQG
jgi:hypothetical protein